MEHPKVIRIGNSMGITIPHMFCKKLGIRIGDFTSCWLTVKDEIVIVKHKEKERS